MTVFMQQIDAARLDPLETLVVDYYRSERRVSVDFCRRAAGTGVDARAIASRLGTSVAEVRRWLDIGRR